MSAQGNACCGGDEAVDAYGFHRVDDGGVFPQCESGDDCKEEYHGLEAQEAGHEGGYEQHARYGAYQHVFYLVCHLARVVLVLLRLLCVLGFRSCMRLL